MLLLTQLANTIKTNAIANMQTAEEHHLMAELRETDIDYGLWYVRISLDMCQYTIVGIDKENYGFQRNRKQL